MHLLAIRNNGQTYRDMNALNDAELEMIAGHEKGLPRGVVVYHQGSTNWDAVLALPEYHSAENESVSDVVAIYQSEHGACRQCHSAPAVGLFVGKFADYSQGEVKTNRPARLRPYRGYICESCANEMECGSFVK